MIAVSGYLLQKNKFTQESKVMFLMTFWLLTLLVPLQVILGDIHGLNTLKYQPAKITAMEAHWDTQARAPLILFAIPDAKKEVNYYVVQVPLLGSLILTHDVNGIVPGLKEWPAEQRPPITLPFFSFRIMVGIGIIMVVLVVISLWLRFRHCLINTVWFLRVCQFSAPLGFLAILAGWVTTETGRQPWTVYGLLRTADSLTPSLTGMDVIFSLASYMLVYLIIFPAGIFFMIRIARKTVNQSTELIAAVEGGQHRSPIDTLAENHHDH